MSRVTDALLAQKAFGIGSNQPMLDATFGGQMGYAPVLTEWVSNAAYVRRNLICVLLEAPRFFQQMPDSQKWIDTLKSLVELHPRSIEGLNAGITLEFDEHPVGGAGEMQQEVIDSKRARSNPVFSFTEKYGMPIQTFLYQWITYGIMDPDTKFALSNTLESGATVEDMLPDQYTASMLFMEPDPQHKRVVKSWVVTNMMPISTGDIIGRRELTAAGEISTLSVEFTGISQFNLGTNLFAQSILDKLSMKKANPYLRPSFVDKIDPKVEASTKGYASEIAALGAAAVPGLR
jgi:hypothetical protein